MEIEIIEAYIIKTKADDIPKGWSLHVYIIDWEMDIRGIMMIKTSSGWIFRMPHLKNYDVIEKKIITYPVISFSDSLKTTNLKDLIKVKAIEFVENKLKTEKP